jgi:predicted ATPase
MYIASFRIENYKSFRTTDAVNLTPGFNVVVGQNNVGKTALVEALSLMAAHVPHRSLAALPTTLTPVRQDSLVEVAFRLTDAELLELLRDAVQPRYVPQYGGQDAQQTIEMFRRSMKAVNDLRSIFQGTGLTSAFLENYSQFPNNPLPAVSFEVRPEGIVGAGGPIQVNRADCCDFKLAAHLQRRVYAFKAERLNIGLCRFGQNVVLQTNASNLAEVLDNLQADPTGFDELNRLFSLIFPTVKRVTVRPAPGDQVEVVIWTVPPDTRRLDLAMPLAACGTGLGQVLAMLYVVLTAQQPRLIIIDEPQSFLHPGAVRKLIEILKEHPQHQFIITTHSPTALIAAEPGTLLRLRIEEGQTIIDRLDVAQARDLRLLLADVGARLSDVFGADSILWVEGLTEEVCFPKIAAARRLQVRGTAIIGVVQTGDFEGRRSATTIQIYQRLSASSGLLPPAVGFIFDREGRTDREREDLERYGNVYFLPRRMYENHLLNPAAIAAVASSIRGFRDTPVTQGEVEALLTAHGWGAADHATWLREVRGNQLLGQLFSQLSERRVEYDKVRHGVALTDWLLQHAPDGLQEVAQLIAQVLRPRAA